MAVASWNEWQNKMSWNGNTGGRNNRGLYDNYVNEYQKFQNAGDDLNLRVLNNAHGFTAGVATDNAPSSGGHHAPKSSGHHSGGGGGDGGSGPSDLDLLIAQILADMQSTPDVPDVPEVSDEPGAGLSATLLSGVGSRPKTRRTYLTPATTVS